MCSSYSIILKDFISLIAQGFIEIFIMDGLLIELLKIVILQGNNTH